MWQRNRWRVLPSMTVGVPLGCRYGSPTMKEDTPLVGFHETAAVVNKIFSYCPTSTQASIRILMSHYVLGSMQVEFRVKVRRCHLSRELS